MNLRNFKRFRIMAIISLLLVAMSCARDDLPPVPEFESLGFSDALEPVRKQMIASYEQLQEEPLDAGRNGQLGMLLSAYGKNSASEILYRRARILAPGEFRWTYHLAIAFRQMGRYDEAAVLFREALEIDPGYHEARIKLAELLLQNNDIDESAGLYREITVELPARVEGWLGLGKALDRGGDLAAAREALQRAKIVGPQYGEVHYALAAVLAAGGDEEAAAVEFAAYERTARNIIHTQDPLMLEVIRLNADGGQLMASADYFLRRGQFAEAVASFRGALVTNPSNQDAWGGLVDSLARLGKTDATAAAYREALAAGISYRRLHLVYGQALRKWQQNDAARDIIARAIEMDPQYADALTAMGELEMQRGASDEAVRQFSRALEVVPNNRDVAFSLTQALNAAGQFDNAANRLETLVSDSMIDESLALKELAIAYHGLDRPEEAIDALQRAREAAKKSADTATVDAIDALLAEWR